AGALAGLILDQLGVSVNAYTKQIGNIEIDYDKFDLDFAKNSALCMPDKDASEKAADYVRELMVEKDSSGGTIECVVDGLKAGFGEPVFDKLDANLAKAIFSIGAVKGFEIGDGFKAAESRGSENNDEFISENGNVTKSTNHSGGILGGISDGSQIVFRAAFKPTPSIAREQKTVDNSGNETEIEIHGRHDPLIVPRAVVVAESMAKLVIVDEIMDGMRSRVSFIKEFYERL
ncbi:MAG: chorismate synthase, partial [Christensenellales bacterium]